MIEKGSVPFYILLYVPFYKCKLMAISNRLMKNGVVMLSVFLLADNLALVQDSNAGDLSPEQREAMQQVQSSEALVQQYQIDQQLLQLDRQKLRDRKEQGANAQALNSLQQTMDAAQARLNADFDRLYFLHQSPHFMQQEMMGYQLLDATDKRKRLQQQQAQHLAQKKQDLRKREEQKSQQQALLVQQQQMIIAQQQSFLAAEQQTAAQQSQNQINQNSGWDWGWGGIFPWWPGYGNTVTSSGKKPLPNRPQIRPPAR